MTTQSHQIHNSVFCVALGRWYVADGPAADLSSVAGGLTAHDTSTSGNDSPGNKNSQQANADTRNEGASRTRRIVMMRGVVSARGLQHTPAVAVACCRICMVELHQDGNAGVAYRRI